MLTVVVLSYYFLSTDAVIFLIVIVSSIYCYHYASVFYLLSSLHLCPLFFFQLSCFARLLPCAEVFFPWVTVERWARFILICHSSAACRECNSSHWQALLAQAIFSMIGQLFQYILFTVSICCQKSLTVDAVSFTGLTSVYVTTVYLFKGSIASCIYWCCIL